MQQKFQFIKPWPVGAVLVWNPELTEEKVREQFRIMKKLGFNCLKQISHADKPTRFKIMHWALDEGLIPWWYGEGGWENPTSQLLESLQIDPGISSRQLRKHPVWLNRQEQIFRERIEIESGIDSRPHQPKSSLPGVQPSFKFELSEDLRFPFLQWLQDKYKTFTNLREAWNCNLVYSKDRNWKSWEDVENELLEVVNSQFMEYKKQMDVFDFRSDMYLLRIKHLAESFHKSNPAAPFRAGGEMGLNLPFAARGVAMEKIARLMKQYGSFYPSMHLAWHYEEVNFETVKPTYMMASLAADWAKGVWSASWEATGGPQQLSGHNATFTPEVRNKFAGFTVNRQVMTQLMLCWIAAGFKGFGLWCWNTRKAGWEAGEYALTDRNMRVTERARIAGTIGRVCNHYRDELWEAKKQPEVGILVNWESDLLWAAISRAGREFSKHIPMRSRTGAARAFINGNIPFEHVSTNHLREGMASRIPCLYLGAQIALDPELINLLIGYVQNGGRIVLDAPSAWYDSSGRLLPTDDGTPFETLFGCRLSEVQYSRQNNFLWTWEKKPLDGFIYELQTTSASVVEEFDQTVDGSKLPVVTENKLGKGSACIIACDASVSCWRPGNDWMEQKIRDHVMENRKVFFECNDATVFYLNTPSSDHFFLLNDSPRQKEAVIRFHDKEYSTMTDVISGEKLDRSDSIPVEPHCGRWVRYQ